MHMRNHYPKHIFFQGFIKSTDHQPTNQLTTDYFPNDSPTPRLVESLTIFERLGNRNMFILQNTNIVEKKYNYTSVYYPKSL